MAYTRKKIVHTVQCSSLPIASTLMSAFSHNMTKFFQKFMLGEETGLQQRQDGQYDIMLTMYFAPSQMVPPDQFDMFLNEVVRVGNEALKRICGMRPECTGFSVVVHNTTEAEIKQLFKKRAQERVREDSFVQAVTTDLLS